MNAEVEKETLYSMEKKNYSIRTEQQLVSSKDMHGIELRMTRLRQNTTLNCKVTKLLLMSFIMQNSTFRTVGIMYQ